MGSLPIAWDEDRPPSLDLIDDCVHCGFCLPTCPSYAVLGQEMDSPRGRIVLMRIGHEEGATLNPEIGTHFDRCLGCMACVTACPSGVQYDRLLERARPQIEREVKRPRSNGSAGARSSPSSLTRDACVCSLPSSPSTTGCGSRLSSRGLRRSPCGDCSDSHLRSRRAR